MRAKSLFFWLVFNKGTIFAYEIFSRTFTLRKNDVHLTFDYS